ncbi:hypothetical protein SLEP1_g8765 [Rubroshorea leprosula]|uniref:Uncharacterized protein n=1 Tax=Rubroshorea leprosula TaxID=152421 RepID=A0AAV5IC10_9ROSI|nr:hypothetical protein SLEP1_g8765 [Rubroshorea leprosula]
MDSSGQDLWGVVGGDDFTPPENNEENAEAFKQWRQKNAEAGFALKRSISHGMFEHIIRCKFANEIWQTLDSSSAERLTHYFQGRYSHPME